MPDFLDDPLLRMMGHTPSEGGCDCGRSMAEHDAGLVFSIEDGTGVGASGISVRGEDALTVVLTVPMATASIGIDGSATSCLDITPQTAIALGSSLFAWASVHTPELREALVQKLSDSMLAKLEDDLKG